MDKTPKERRYEHVKAYQSFTKEYREKIKFLEDKLQNENLSDLSRQGYTILLEICNSELKKTTKELRNLIKASNLL